MIFGHQPTVRLAVLATLYQRQRLGVAEEQVLVALMLVVDILVMVAETGVNL
jgi:hypothetical protein